MAKVSDRKRFVAICKRVSSLRENHGDEIEHGRFVRLDMGAVVPEMEWLVKEVKRLTRGSEDEEEDGLEVEEKEDVEPVAVNNPEPRRHPSTAKMPPAAPGEVFEP